MLGEMVIALGYATQRDINEALCDSLGIDFVDMRETEISDDVLSMLDENIMRKYTLVPLGDAPDNPGAIRVAMADPTNILAMDDINIVTGKQVVPVLANATDINAFLDKAFGQKQAQSIVDLYKKEQGETVREETKEDKAERRCRAVSESDTPDGQRMESQRILMRIRTIIRMGRLLSYIMELLRTISS